MQDFDQQNWPKLSCSVTITTRYYFSRFSFCVTLLGETWLNMDNWGCTKDEKTSLHKRIFENTNSNSAKLPIMECLGVFKNCYQRFWSWLSCSFESFSILSVVTEKCSNMHWKKSSFVILWCIDLSSDKFVHSEENASTVSSSSRTLYSHSFTIGIAHSIHDWFVVNAMRSV